MAEDIKTFTPDEKLPQEAETLKIKPETRWRCRGAIGNRGGWPSPHLKQLAQIPS